MPTILGKKIVTPQGHMLLHLLLQLPEFKEIAYRVNYMYKLDKYHKGAELLNNETTWLFIFNAYNSLCKGPQHESFMQRFVKISKPFLAVSGIDTTVDLGTMDIYNYLFVKLNSLTHVAQPQNATNLHLTVTRSNGCNTPECGSCDYIFSLEFEEGLNRKMYFNGSWNEDGLDPRLKQLADKAFLMMEHLFDPDRLYQIRQLIAELNQLHTNTMDIVLNYLFVLDDTTDETKKRKIWEIDLSWKTDNSKIQVMEEERVTKKQKLISVCSDNQ